VEYPETNPKTDPQVSLRQLPGNMDHLRTKIKITKTDANKARQDIEEARQKIFSDLEQIRARHRQRKKDCEKLLANSSKMQEIAQTMAAIEHQLNQTQTAIEIKLASESARSNAATNEQTQG
jgi:phosphoglycerate-specific signal transduction histidine kinase